jgi:hypothetical protein
LDEFEQSAQFIASKRNIDIKDLMTKLGDWNIEVFSNILFEHDIEIISAKNESEINGIINSEYKRDPS